MTGHFVGLDLPTPPGGATPTGSYLSIVVSARTLLLLDLRLSVQAPPKALATLGPVTNITP
jgi:hypothetical protein